MQPSSHKIALVRYARLRRTAYDSVAEEAIRTGLAPSTLRLTDIDERALSAWRQTWQGEHPSGEGGWDWDVLSAPFQRRPAAFHVALWSGEQLCGLAMGRVSTKRPSGLRHTISVHYMEGAPAPRHPLKKRVLALVIAAAELYGSALGAPRLRLVNPLPGMVDYYRALGFTVVRERGRRVYCERRIER